MKPISSPDITNEDPKYWEKVLKSHNLSVDRGDSTEEAESDKEGFLSEERPTSVPITIARSKRLPGLDQHFNESGDIIDDGEEE